MDGIIIKGAKTHNLKNVDLTLPRGKMIVFTGLSGSGKSSLAFDTLYAEGQRRYVESISTYARQFLELMPRPDVESIEGLSPAIAIDQKGVSHNPRSTVGTVTEVADYLRLLMARLGTPYCPTHKVPLRMDSIANIVDQILALPAETRIMMLTPVLKDFVGDCTETMSEMLAQGFSRFRIDGEVSSLTRAISLNDGQPHTVEVVVDRLKVGAENRTRLADSAQTAARLGHGRVWVRGWDDASISLAFSTSYSCPHCDFTVGKLEPAMFSPNSPEGCCRACGGTGLSKAFDLKKIVDAPFLSLESGAVPGWDMRNAKNYKRLKLIAPMINLSLTTPWDKLPKAVQDATLYGTPQTCDAVPPFYGIVGEMERLWSSPFTSKYMREGLEKFRSETSCPECHGTRLRTEASNVFVQAGEQRYSIGDLGDKPLEELEKLLQTLTFSPNKAELAERVVTEVVKRLQFLCQVGLGYLSLDRRTDSLSGGEAQRIRLASQIGSGLTGVMYVLDEPSIGLHQRDNDRLLDSLKALRDLGNTLIVVEHDEDAIRSADYVVDLGPGAGELGGEVMAAGTPKEIMANPKSLTGQYLSGKKSVTMETHRARKASECLSLINAHGHNLKNVDLRIPLGNLVTVSGVSGSGKSSLVIDTLFAALQRDLHNAKTTPLPFDRIDNLSAIDKVVMVDQSPIGRTPRSNPATYSGLFTLIREVFEQTQMSRERGYTAGRFSFNVKGGRCEACQGDGLVKMEMHFLPDVYVPCEACHGRRYNRETLEVKYKGLDIAEVLDLTVTQALEIFSAYPRIMRILEAFDAVGLGYIRLGQSATTFSGGEAQRVKLATELARPETGRTLFILDEPTTGLHFADIAQLLKVLHQLVRLGNTVLVIEHNLDVILDSDWVIDMGPDGGKAGGRVLCEGTPEDLAKCQESATAPYLRRLMKEHQERVQEAGGTPTKAKAKVTKAKAKA